MKAPISSCVQLDRRTRSLPVTLDQTSTHLEPINMIATVMKWTLDFLRCHGHDPCFCRLIKSRYRLLIRPSYFAGCA